MAIYGFRGLGWLFACAVVMPTCYLVTSQGAAEQAKLTQVERDIVRAKMEIRSLNTEFGAIVNGSQLDRWNLELAMGAPAPEQYLPNETALASYEPGEVQPTELALVKPLPKVEREAPVEGELKLALADKAAKLPALASTDGGKAARTQAVAMLEPKFQLSADTIDDLKARAKIEKQALR